MYLDSDRRGTAMSPGLALRIAILGGVALVMFAIVFFRLWYLEVLSGNHYLAPSGEEVQLSDPSFLRAPSIHAEMRRAGARVL